MGPFTKLVERAVPLAVVEPFSMVNKKLVLVLRRPEVSVRFLDTLMELLFRVTPDPVLAITNRVNTGTGVPPVALILCAPVPENVAVPAFDPKVMAEAAGEVTVTFPA